MSEEERAKKESKEDIKEQEVTGERCEYCKKNPLISAPTKTGKTDIVPAPRLILKYANNGLVIWQCPRCKDIVVERLDE